MRAVTWSADALREFDHAIYYIAKDDPRAALNVADQIEQAVLLLRDYPVGRQGRVTGTYEKPVTRTPYIIAYALSDEAVTILRIIHSSRNWMDESWPD